MRTTAFVVCRVRTIKRLKSANWVGGSILKIDRSLKKSRAGENLRPPRRYKKGGTKRDEGNSFQRMLQSSARLIGTRTFSLSLPARFTYTSLYASGFIFCLSFLLHTYSFLTSVMVRRTVFRSGSPIFSWKSRDPFKLSYNPQRILFHVIVSCSFTSSVTYPTWRLIRT